MAKWIADCKWENVRDTGAEANTYTRLVADGLERLGRLLDDVVRVDSCLALACGWGDVSILGVVCDRSVAVLSWLFRPVCFSEYEYVIAGVVAATFWSDWRR